MTIFENYLSDYIQRVSRVYSLDTLYDFGGNISLDLKCLNNFLTDIHYFTNCDKSIGMINAVRNQDLDKLNSYRADIRILAKLNKINIETVQLASLTFEDKSKYISNTDVNESLSYYSKTNTDRLESRTIDLNTIDKIHSYLISDNIKNIDIKDNSVVIIDFNYKQAISDELLSNILKSIENKENILVFVISDDSLSATNFYLLDNHSIDVSKAKRKQIKTEYLYIMKNNHKEIESLMNNEDDDF